MAARQLLNLRFAPITLGLLLVGPAACDDGQGTGQPGNGTPKQAAPKDGGDKPTAPKPATPKIETIDVKLDGKKFTLELALDADTRFKGLSGRTEIKENGGMLFAFDKPQKLEFVMRDCPIPIDIIFIDASGRITATHKMVPESPRGEDELINDPRIKTNEKYDKRLKKYPSKFDAQFVIELKGNTLDTIKLKDAQKIDLDWAALKKRAK